MWHTMCYLFYRTLYGIKENLLVEEKKQLTILT